MRKDLSGAPIVFWAILDRISLHSPDDGRLDTNMPPFGVSDKARAIAVIAVNLAAANKVRTTGRNAC